MNLLIKGMDMPRCCAECQMRYMAIGYDWECVFTNDDVRDYDKKRLPNCPLTEIPTPHGRLIDADRLIAVLKSTTAISQSDYNLFNHIVGLIEHQPTVIEKEMN